VTGARNCFPWRRIARHGPLRQAPISLWWFASRMCRRFGAELTSGQGAMLLEHPRSNEVGKTPILEVMAPLTWAAGPLIGPGRGLARRGKSPRQADDPPPAFPGPPRRPSSSAFTCRAWAHPAPPSVQRKAGQRSTCPSSTWGPFLLRVHRGDRGPGLPFDRTIAGRRGATAFA